MGRRFLILIAVVGGLAVWTIGGMYNGLVKGEQAIENQWAQVETQYQRRFDLIPSLVKTAKGYMQHEKDVFLEVSLARQSYANAHTMKSKVDASEQMEGALGRLLAIAEAYPDLKANQTMLALMDELAGTENRVATERMRFNREVKQFNTRVRTFPTKVFAGMMGFEPMHYFKPQAGSENAPNIEF